MHQNNGSFNIIRPAPGLPAFLQGEENFTAIVAHDGNDANAVRNWAQKLALRAVDNGASIPLEVEAVEHCDAAAADSLISGFAALSESRRLSFSRIKLRAMRPLTPTPPCRVRLYDILFDGRIERPRSVAAIVPSAGKLMLAFASDLHLASAWDAIADAVDRYTPDLSAGLLRPKRQLEKFVGEMNSLTAKGQLDVVVLGGDLIDHVYTHSRNGTPNSLDNSNVKILLDALASLRAPTITIPGNHDYRLHPWRPRTYGLEAVGIPASRTKALLQKAGLWSRWPICFADLHSLRSKESCGRSALAHYLTHLAPATDFTLNLHGVRLMFVSTGRDVISQWRNVEHARSGLLLRSLRHAWLNPDSEGLSDAQIVKIASWLQMPGGGTVPISGTIAERWSAKKTGLSPLAQKTETPAGSVLFFHAPLLHANNHAGVGRHVGRIDPGADGDMASHVAFEHRLKRAGMRNGVCFRNADPLLRVLAAAQGPVVTFSGHVHQPSAVQLDRAKMILHTVDPVPPTDPGRTVTLFTASALGHVPIGNHQPPGYFLAHFEDGALVSLDRQPI
jgi:hypothetical protein